MDNFWVSAYGPILTQQESLLVGTVRQVGLTHYHLISSCAEVNQKPVVAVG